MKYLSTLLATLPLAIVASPSHAPHAHRASHAELAHKIRAPVPAPVAEPLVESLEVRSDETSLAKRQSGNFEGRMTYYQTGLGACGQWNNPGDFIVALNSAQLNAYGGYSQYPPAICWSSITISYNGKQVGATVVDECPTCGWGELDLSQGLFEQFPNTGQGVFHAQWWFNGSGGPAPQPQPSPTPSPEPQPQPQPQPSPTSTYVPPPPPTTSSSSSPPPPPPTTSSAAPTSSSSSAAAEAPETTSSAESEEIVIQTGNLYNLAVAVGGLGQLIRLQAEN